MIKLKFKFESREEILSFSKKEIIIGSACSLSADIFLHIDTISAEHVKIIENENSFFIINCTNDPFLTLNGHSFKKKYIFKGDLLQIGQAQFIFESDSFPIKENELLQSLEEKIAKQNQIHSNEIQFDNDFEHLSELLKDHKHFPSNDELNAMDIESLMEEIDPLNLSINNIDPQLFEMDWNGDPQLIFDDAPKRKPKKSLPDQLKTSEKIKLKDDLIGGVLDEDSEVTPTNKTHPFADIFFTYTIPWKWIGIVISLSFIIFAIFSTIFYLSLKEKTKDEELRAAMGLADMAMAMTHAQVYQMKPHNHNWSDSDFLMANLMSALPKKYPAAVEINSNHQFTCCSFGLRIYTSNDLSHFVLIAQPSPNFLQWLVPKAAILTDSREMELRKIKDLRKLNRLLANPEGLNNSNAEEISQLIKQGELISLSILAKEMGHPEFSPPKDLGLIKPGAQNLIYNAPRYYKFEQPFMQNIVQLSVNPHNNEAMTFLKSEAKFLSQLPNLVLYSSQGKKAALQAQKGLATFALEEKFLVGFLMFNSNGLISNSQLLSEGLKNENKTEKLSDNQSEEFDILAYEILSKNEQSVEPLFLPHDDEMDINHPLYIKLSMIAKERQKTIVPFSKELVKLLLLQNNKAVVDFKKQFKQSYARYEQMCDEQKDEIGPQLASLCKDYQNNMSLAHFMVFVKAVGLDAYMNEPYISEKKPLEKFDLSALLNLIQASKNLTELNINVKETVHFLNLENVPDPHQLILYQTMLRKEVMEKLSQFLFSPDAHLPHSDFHLQNEQVLLMILKNTWVIDPEERDYFLEEFKHFYN